LQNGRYTGEEIFDGYRSNLYLSYFFGRDPERLFEGGNGQSREDLSGTFVTGYLILDHNQYTLRE
jgi:hypothetical protein